MKFLNNLVCGSVIDNILFWKTIKPFFSNKNNHNTNIKLVEGDEILKEDEKTAKELNNLLQNPVFNSNIQEHSFFQSQDYHNLSDPIQRAIAKCKHHLSVLLIQSKISNR